MSPVAAWVVFLQPVRCTGSVLRIGTFAASAGRLADRDAMSHVDAVVPHFSSIDGSWSIVIIVRPQFWRKVAVLPRSRKVFGQLLQFGICRRWSSPRPVVRQTPVELSSPSAAVSSRRQPDFAGLRTPVLVGVETHGLDCKQDHFIVYYSCVWWLTRSFRVFLYIENGTLHF